MSKYTVESQISPRDRYTFKRIKEVYGCYLIIPRIYPDERGHYMEFISEEEFAEVGLPVFCTLGGLSLSHASVLRGLHYQKSPYTQAKLLMLKSGKVRDVVADLRINSPTFGSHATFLLDTKHPKLVYIPAGCAHGVYSLSDNSEIIYFSSNSYRFGIEGGVLYDSLPIDWKIPKGVTPIMNAKDKALPAFEEIRNEFAWMTKEFILRGDLPPIPRD